MSNVKKKILVWVGIFAVLAVVLLASGVAPVLSESVTGVKEELRNEALGQIQAAAGETTGEEPIDPRRVVVMMIQILLSLLGTIFLILLVLSGYWFFTAKGEDEKVKKALDTARRAVFGLIITLLAYAIVKFVMGGLDKVI